MLFLFGLFIGSASFIAGMGIFISCLKKKGLTIDVFGNTAQQSFYVAAVLGSLIMLFSAPVEIFVASSVHSLGQYFQYATGFVLALALLLYWNKVLAVWTWAWRLATRRVLV